MTDHIAMNIKNFRNAAGFSQQELAKRVSVTRQAISNWERGVSLPDIDMVILLAKEFHVEAVDILGKERPIDEFLKMKPKRIKITLIFGIIFLAAVLLSITLVPYLYANRRFNMLPYTVASVTVLPLVYTAGSIFALSLLSIWFDFRIGNKANRMTLIVLALSFLLLDVSMNLIVIFGSASLKTYLKNRFHYSVYFDWLISYPVIFIFPGAMLFCGFNKKAVPLPSKTARNVK